MRRARVATVLLCALLGASMSRAQDDFVISRSSHPDGEGLSRDVRYLVAYQFFALGVLYAVPEDVSTWTAEEKRTTSLRRYFHNMTHPVIDRDSALFNYGLHPYFGSAYFLSARDRGLSRWDSFVYSVGASCMYEFGVESIAEPASIQDLIVTPIAGSALALMLEPVLDRIRSDPRPGPGHALLAGVLDPFGEWNHAVDGLLGFSSRSVVQVRPLRHGGYTGLTLSHRW